MRSSTLAKAPYSCAMLVAVRINSPYSNGDVSAAADDCAAETPAAETAKKDRIA